jgi:manganese transport protein
VIFCGDRRLMGTLVNSRATNLAGWAVAATIVALNVYLLAQTFGMTISG